MQAHALKTFHFRSDVWRQLRFIHFIYREINLRLYVFTFFPNKGTGNFIFSFWRTCSFSRGVCWNWDSHFINPKGFIFALVLLWENTTTNCNCTVTIYMHVLLVPKLAMPSPHRDPRVFSKRPAEGHQPPCSRTPNVTCRRQRVRQRGRGGSCSRTLPVEGIYGSDKMEWPCLLSKVKLSAKQTMTTHPSVCNCNCNCNVWTNWLYGSDAKPSVEAHHRSLVLTHLQSQPRQPKVSSCL